MKKFLLSLGLLAGMASMNAAVYTVYDASNKGTWKEQGTGFTSTVTVDGQSFTLSSDQASSTNKLMNPGTSDQWRVYKGSSITVASADVVMKGIRITFDGSKYAVEGTLSSGWTGKVADLLYTLESAGSKEMTMTASSAQIRISKIEVSDEAFSGDAPVTPPVTPSETVVKSIKETVALADKTPIKVEYDLTVAFVNHNNVFVTDAAGDFIQIYGANEYKENDIIPAGWTATYELYKGVTPEITGASLPVASGEGKFVPAIVNPKDITIAMVNNVIAVKDVEITAATPGEDATSSEKNFVGVCDGTELNLRNNYQLPSVEAGKYNMTLLVTIFDNAPSLYVINYDANISSTVLNTYDTMAAAPEFYTLQGVKVSNPESGLFIRVQNGKATKVLVK